MLTTIGYLGTNIKESTRGIRSIAPASSLLKMQGQDARRFRAVARIVGQDISHGHRKIDRCYTPRAMNPLVFNLAALAALVPSALLLYRRGPGPQQEVRDPAFWGVLAAAAAGAMAWTWVVFGSVWQTGIAASLWIIISLSGVVMVARRDVALLIFCNNIVLGFSLNYIARIIFGFSVLVPNLRQPFFMNR